MSTLLLRLSTLRESGYRMSNSACGTFSPTAKSSVCPSLNPLPIECGNGERCGLASTLPFPQHSPRDRIELREHRWITGFGRGDDGHIKRAVRADGAGGVLAREVCS
jgi:hypothetical protein